MYVSFKWKQEHWILDNYNVLVTRQPTVFPSDFRVLKAVYRKELAHLRDCIIFPVGQFRPHQDIMAGGDCDGDLYQVIYNPKIVNRVVQVPSELAMDYILPKQHAPSANSNLEEARKQLISCIIENKISDDTGILGSHLAYEIEKKDGVNSQTYKKLGMLYYQSIVSYCLSVSNGIRRARRISKEQKEKTIKRIGTKHGLF